MADEELPRDNRWAVALGVVGVALLALIWFWTAPTLIAFVPVLGPRARSPGRERRSSPT